MTEKTYTEWMLETIALYARYGIALPQPRVPADPFWTHLKAPKRPTV